MVRTNGEFIYDIRVFSTILLNRYRQLRYIVNGLVKARNRTTSKKQEGME